MSRRLFFISIFVFLLFLFCWCLCSLYSFWWLLSIFHCIFDVVFESSYRCIDTIFNASDPASSFSWHIQSVYVTSGCKTLNIVMLFLVLWFICFSFLLIHFKNGPEYLKCRTSQAFILLMKSMLYSLVLNIFLVLLRCFYVFSFISTCLVVSTSNISKYLYVSFSPNISDFFSIGGSIILVICHFPLLIVSTVHLFDAEFPLYVLNVYSHCLY